MGFDPCNCSLKIRESIDTPTPKMGIQLGVWGFIPSHSPTFLGAWNVTPGLYTWPAPSQALALAASPRLGLQHLGLILLLNVLVFKLFSGFFQFQRFDCFTFFQLLNFDFIYFKGLPFFVLHGLETI